MKYWPWMILFPSLCFATSKHMVQISSNGVGASGSYQKTDPENDSKFKSFEVSKGDIELNYAHTIFSRFQLGGLVTSRTEKRSFKTKNGQEGKVTFDQMVVALFALWNFSEQLDGSFYLGGMVSWINDEEEFSKNVFNYLEDDKIARQYELIFGKRFSLTSWGLQNITYSPAFSVFYQNAKKDYKDDGLKDIFAVELKAIKLDILF